MALFETLVDPFEGALNGTLWTASGNSTAFSQFYQLQTGTGTNVTSKLYTNTTYDLTSSKAAVEGFYSTNVDNVFSYPLMLRNLAETEAILFYTDKTSINARFISGGVTTTIRSVLFDTVNEAPYSWQFNRLRIREESGITYWENSKDGYTWEQFASRANPITVTALYAEMRIWNTSTLSSARSYNISGFNSFFLPTTYLSQYKDNFDTFNTSFWNASSGAYVENGKMFLPTDASSYIQRTTKNYGFDESFLELCYLPQTADFLFTVQDDLSGFRPGFYIEEGELYASIYDEDTSNPLGTYDNVQHRWLKIKYDIETNVYTYETSPDSIEWTILYSTEGPGELRAYGVYIYGGSSGPNVANSNFAIIDNFNIGLKDLKYDSAPVYIYSEYDSQNNLIQTIKTTDKFEIEKTVNTAGSRLSFTIPAALESEDVSIVSDVLIDEDENIIVDNDTNEINVGDSYELGAIPSIGNVLKVTEISEYQPQGVTVFDGIITKWESNYSQGFTNVFAFSKGITLDNTLVQVLPEETITEQNTYDNFYVIYGAAIKAPTYSRDVAFHQTFTVSVTSEVNGVYLYMKKTIGGSAALRASLSLREGTPLAPGTVLSSVDVLVSQTDVGLAFFQFPTAVTLSSGDTYHITITNPDGSNLSETNLLSVYYNSAGGYPSGQSFVTNETTGVASQTTDLYFKIVSSSGATGAAFVDQDPSQIVRDLLDNAISLGALVSYTDTSIEDTGTLVSYTFKFETYYDAIKKCVQLAPGNWYFYVDPGTNVVYFKEKSRTPDHILSSATIASDLIVGHSLEDIKNLVYFSGGDVGSGDNLVLSDADQQSINQYGTWLDLPSDNRITDEANAQAVIDGILIEKSMPRFYATKVKIPTSKYYTYLLRPGQSVGFNNYNDVVNSLVLQIVSINYNSEVATLDLEILPMSLPRRIDDLRRKLLVTDTENNPVT